MDPYPCSVKVSPSSQNSREYWTDGCRNSVEISPPILDQLVSLCEDPSSSFDDATELSESLYLAAWSRNHRKVVGDVASRLYRSQTTQINSYLDRGMDAAM